MQNKEWVPASPTGRHFIGRGSRLCLSPSSGKAMPVSLLWAVDAYGRVYCLSTVGQQWEQSRNAQMEFKRVTAAQLCCWGIACDNNIYLNVHASDLPIRYQEHTFENQRWNPVDGFSDRLLLSDRWQWSDITGLQHQPLDSFQLPSSNWEWEGDWYVDENLEGEPTEKEVCVLMHLFSLLFLHTSCINVFAFAGVDICHGFSCHLHQRKEVELLCPSQAMAPLQEVQRHGHLG
ncbi:hypothetical protein CHARACLAT_015403 [Characodon lateralis]|uniref:Peroxin/Ferlin domain-containing protein n=1 Tax=Characodon lateralis TaxID=208331 RepID=A0ABU7EKZ4_9TELE|nr:hypothetical protein [Characodon lateralis]